MRAGLRPLPQVLLGLRPGDQQVSWVAWDRLSKDCALQSSRAPAKPAQWLGSGLDRIAGAVSMSHSPWRPQHLSMWITVMKVTASVCPFKFQTLVQLDQLSTPRRWPEAGVKLQEHCTPLLQVHLCGWGYSQRRAIVVSWELI